jgi:hypothetical protein
MSFWNGRNAGEYLIWTVVRLFGVGGVELNCRGVRIESDEGTGLKTRHYKAGLKPTSKGGGSGAEAAGVGMD